MKIWIKRLMCWHYYHYKCFVPIWFGGLNRWECVKCGKLKDKTCEWEPNPFQGVLGDFEKYGDNWTGKV